MRYTLIMVISFKRSLLGHIENNASAVSMSLVAVSWLGFLDVLQKFVLGQVARLLYDRHLGTGIILLVVANVKPVAVVATTSSHPSFFGASLYIMMLDNLIETVPLVRPPPTEQKRVPI